jgi:hypothetical protein
LCSPVHAGCDGVVRRVGMLRFPLLFILYFSHRVPYSFLSFSLLPYLESCASPTRARFYHSKMGGGVGAYSHSKVSLSSRCCYFCCYCYCQYYYHSYQVCCLLHLACSIPPLGLHSSAQCLPPLPLSTALCEFFRHEPKDVCRAPSVCTPSPAVTLQYHSLDGRLCLELCEGLRECLFSLL